MWVMKEKENLEMVVSEAIYCKSFILRWMTRYGASWRMEFYTHITEQGNFSRAPKTLYDMKTEGMGQPPGLLLKQCSAEKFRV